MPETVEEIEQGEHDWIRPRPSTKFTTPDDVIVFAWSGGGGYGDPIERDPETVREDVAAGRVPRDWARPKAYGVVLAGAGREGHGRRAGDRAPPARRSSPSGWPRAARAATPARAGSDSAGRSADQRLTEYVEIATGSIRADDVVARPADPATTSSARWSATCR